jgi:hypothetical protein
MLSDTLSLEKVYTGAPEARVRCKTDCILQVWMQEAARHAYITCHVTSHNHRQAAKEHQLQRSPA